MAPEKIVPQIFKALKETFEAPLGSVPIDSEQLNLSDRPHSAALSMSADGGHRSIGYGLYGL